MRYRDVQGVVCPHDGPVGNAYGTGLSLPSAAPKKAATAEQKEQHED